MSSRTPQEAKTALHETVARDIVQDYLTYRSAALGSEDPDDARRLVDMQIRLIGAEPDRKAGVNDNLPTFNFIFNQGGLQATIEPAPVQLVQDVTPQEALEHAIQAAETTMPQVVEFDFEAIDDLVADLDLKLQGV